MSDPFTDPFTDMEERLADALAHGAQGAPAAIGLAAAARTRARQRRRTRLAGAAVLAVLAIGVPTAVLATGGSDGNRDGAGPADDGKVTDPVEGSGGVPNGYHVESWHSVSVEVPNTWEYGALTTWCSGGSATDPRIGRPGVTILIACTPLSSYGVEFAPANGKDVQWPVAAQHSDSWPDGAYVGATTVNDVVVTVAARKSTVTEAILDSVRAIGPEGDPYGCTSSRGEARPEVPEGGLAVCRYDEEGLLEQSELLTGDDAAAALAALEAAPVFVGDCTGSTGQPFQVVRMRSDNVEVDVDLGGSCPLIRGLEPDRALTADVLYWALSPGWTGAVDAAIPLPPELRQR